MLSGLGLMRKGLVVDYAGSAAEVAYSGKPGGEPGGKPGGKPGGEPRGEARGEPWGAAAPEAEAAVAAAE